MHNGIIYFHIRPFGYYLKQTHVDDYLKEFWAKQGTTFACEQRSDKNWYVAFAQCSQRDQFNRRMGRMVAAGRLRCKRKPDLAILFGKDEPSFDDCVTMLNLIEYNEKYEHLEEFYKDEPHKVHDIMTSYTPVEAAMHRVYQASGIGKKKTMKGIDVYA